MLKVICIALGGAFGSVLRYWLHGFMQRWTESRFPVGTMTVNLLGCLLIGVLAALFGMHSSVREEYRLGLTVGILGGFTTFSTFGLETFKLLDDGHLGWGLANIALSCGLGLLAVWCGYRVAEWLSASVR
jgi:CrcB protein